MQTHTHTLLTHPTQLKTKNIKIYKNFVFGTKNIQLECGEQNGTEKYSLIQKIMCGQVDNMLRVRTFAGD